MNTPPTTHDEQRARDREEVVRRFASFDITPAQASEMAAARAAFASLAGDIFDTTVTSREQGKAIEALELAKYWTNQAIARYGVAQPPALVDPSVCPTCESPRPTLHPAVQEGGEVGVCSDPFHASTAEGRVVLARLGVLS